MWMTVCIDTHYLLCCLRISLSRREYSGQPQYVWKERESRSKLRIAHLASFLSHRDSTAVGARSGNETAHQGETHPLFC